jgi:hypothetical protein
LAQSYWAAIVIAQTSVLALTAKPQDLPRTRLGNKAPTTTPNSGAPRSPSATYSWGRNAVAADQPQALDPSDVR